MKRQNKVLVTRLVAIFLGLCAITGVGAAQQTLDFGEVAVGSSVILAPYLLILIAIIGISIQFSKI